MFEGDASQVVQLKAIVRWTDVVYLDMLRKYTLTTSERGELVGWDACHHLPRYATNGVKRRSGPFGGWT